MDKNEYLFALKISLIPSNYMLKVIELDANFHGFFQYSRKISK